MESIVDDVISIRKPEVRIIKNGYLKVSTIKKRVNDVDLYNSIKQLKMYFVLQFHSQFVAIFQLSLNNFNND